MITQDKTNDTLAPRKVDTDFGSFSRHPRYLSAFDSNVIQLDVRTKGASSEKIYSIDLNNTFAGHGGLSVYTEPMPMSNFSNITKTIKYVINNRLSRHHNSSVIASEMSQIFNFYRNFYSYLFRQGIYSVEQIEKNDIDSFVTEFIENDGWWNLLGYSEALASLFDRLEKEPSLASVIAGVGIKDKARFSLNTHNISKLTGLPIRSYTPADFSEKVRKKYFPKTLSKKLTNEFRNIVSAPVLENVFKRINDLNELPQDVDRIDFVPFPTASKYAKQLAKVKSEGRTLNITPEYAVKLITTAYDWIYNKGPGVIELLETARETAEDSHNSNLQGRYKGDKVRSAVQAKYKKIKDNYGFEYKSIGLDGCRPGHDSCLGQLIRTVHFAAFNMIGINHGRRKNELLGEGDRPYGLYLGCTSIVYEDLDMHRINIFVEKTIQDWSEFWCNKLVVDSIEILEQIHQLIRPLNTPHLKPTGNLDEDISNKLFAKRFFADVDRWADTSLHGESLQHADYAKESDVFFNIVTPDGSKLDSKSHPNRRLFGCLYYYRFEFPELLALRDYLGHRGTIMTHTYVSDPDTRKLSDQMSKLWEMEQAGFDSVLDEIQAEYFKGIISQIMDGERVGGYWPRLVAKRIKTLSRNVKFNYESLNQDEKIDLVYKKLSAKGYKPNPKSNGACMVGDSKVSRRFSNCFDETLNPQDAEPRICSGCIHLFTNENYINVMADDLMELEVTSKDFKLPSVVRIEAENHANDLREVLKKETKISEENQKYLSINILKWDTEAK